MSDFQAYLDASLSKIKIINIVNPDMELPKRDIYRVIREMISSERKEKKLTQKQLAQKTGLSQANISNIEKGASHPTIETLVKIADALGKQLVITFEESEDEIL